MRIYLFYKNFYCLRCYYLFLCMKECIKNEKNNIDKDVLYVRKINNR